MVLKQIKHWSLKSNTKMNEQYQPDTIEYTTVIRLVTIAKMD